MARAPSASHLRRLPPTTKRSAPQRPYAAPARWLVLRARLSACHSDPHPQASPPAPSAGSSTITALCAHDAICAFKSANVRCKDAVETRPRWHAAADCDLCMKGPDRMSHQLCRPRLRAAASLLRTSCPRPASAVVGRAGRSCVLASAAAAAGSLRSVPTEERAPPRRLRVSAQLGGEYTRCRKRGRSCVDWV